MGEVIEGPWQAVTADSEEGDWCMVCGAPVEPLALMCDTCQEGYDDGRA